MPKTALVTGGARGIGFGIATEFVNAGFNVMIADLGDQAGDWNYALSDDSALAKAAQGLNELCKAPTNLPANNSAAATTVDVTNAESCTRAVAATIKEFQGLDVLVNNAGIVHSGTLDEFTEQHWDQVFAVNTKGIFLMSKAALPALQASADAAIVNTASIAGKKGYPNMSAYCGSKFAAIGITQSLAAELAPANVRVNAICPGMVGTAMWLEHLLPSNTTDANEKSEEFEAAMHSTIPLGRPQTVADMGAAALYLATAPNVTGVALSIAGGFEMN